MNKRLDKHKMVLWSNIMVGSSFSFDCRQKLSRLFVADFFAAFGSDSLYIT
jgi:hypothetical protein